VDTRARSLGELLARKEALCALFALASQRIFHLLVDLLHIQAKTP